MRWNQQDISQYVQAKEYIDSLIIPLLPFQLSDDNNTARHAFQSEVLNIFANELEKELTGRTLLTPGYFYLVNEDPTIDITKVNQIVDHVLTQPFQHIFFLTFDPQWKKHEKELNGNLIWLPGVSSGDINSKETVMIVREQVKQVSELIRSYW